MEIIKSKTSKELGIAAAKLAAQKLNAAIAEKGCARIILSTGASQFETLEALVKEDVDWSKVEMFHLDEYVNLPETHIAFNDPLADFNTRESYFVVNLDEKCRMQQVGEGWFDSISDVPAQAISMTPYRIMQCKTIISVVPHAVKAWAVKSTIESKETTPMIPATLLKEHADWYLFVDENSGKDI